MAVAPAPRWRVMTRSCILQHSVIGQLMWSQGTLIAEGHLYEAPWSIFSFVRSKGAGWEGLCYP